MATKSDLVRCVACCGVYEKSQDAANGAAGTTCPECGEAAWVAVTIPPPDGERSYA